MSDGDRLLKAWDNRDWLEFSGIIGANVAFFGCMVGCFLLVLLLSIHALDWLGALPCLCL